MWWFETIQQVRGGRRRHWPNVLLAGLFVLASAAPPLAAVLPRDPLVIAAGRSESGPTIWFPLAYALSGLPVEPARPARNPLAQFEAQQAHGSRLGVLAWVDPALLVHAALWLGPLSLASLLLRTPGLRASGVEPSLPDPPPRSRIAPACMA
jgi:hypothetical protein